MNFKNGVDLIDYITENNLLDTAWNANPNFSKKYYEVWFGNIEFWSLEGTGDRIAIVHHIYEKTMMDLKLDEIEEYCVDNAFQEWVIPSEFIGEIVYSSNYVKDLKK